MEFGRANQPWQARDFWTSSKINQDERWSLYPAHHRAEANALERCSGNIDICIKLNHQIIQTILYENQYYQSYRSYKKCKSCKILNNFANNIFITIDGTSTAHFM